MGSMQCNVEFEYQLSICSGTTENLDPFKYKFRLTQQVLTTNVTKILIVGFTGKNN
jgi:hypothetical protein